MRYRNIIFDLDGVLVFTDKYHYLAWKAIADKHNIPFDENINNRLRGVSRMESLDIILSYSKKNYSIHERSIMAEEKNNIYKSLLNNLTSDSVNSKTIDVLEELRSMNISMAIGSSSKNAELILQKIGIMHFFDAVSSGLNISQSKPNPEVFLKAAEYLNAHPKSCLVVEDAHAGIEAAQNGGFDSVGIGDAYYSDIATYKIRNIKELINIVKQ